MSAEVTVTEVPTQPTAVVAATTTWKEFPGVWRPLLDQVYAVVQPGPTRRNVMLYRDNRPSVEVGVTMDTEFAPTGRVVASMLPGGRVARAVHRGPYPALGDTHQAVLDHCAAHGLEPTGVRWEIYGHHREDPAELETEVVWLLA